MTSVAQLNMPVNNTLRKLCSQRPPYNGRDSAEKQILKALSSLSKGEVPELDSLSNYLKYFDGVNSKIVKEFVERQTVIDAQEDSVRKILIRLPFRNKDLYDKTLETMKKKGFVFEESYLKSFVNCVKDFHGLSDTHFTTYCDIVSGFIKLGFKVDPVVEFLLFDSKVHERYSYRSYYTKTIKERIVKMLKKCNITVKPSIKDLEKAYEKGYSVSIELLQDTYGLKANDTCFKNFIKKNASGGSYLSSSNYTFISGMLKRGLKPDENDLKNLMKLRGRDDFIKIIIDQNNFDLQKHGPVILENFDCITKPETIRRLIKAGFKPDQKCLEKACEDTGNINILRLLIDEYGLKASQVCLENACKHRSNTAIINYLLDKGNATPNVQCMLNLSKAFRNNTLTLIVEKFLKANGDEFEPLKPIYESDSDEETKTG